MFYFMRYPELMFRKAYDNMTDAMMQSTSTTYYGFGEETATALEAVAVAVEDDFPGRARALERVLAPGLERVRKTYPDVVTDVRGAGALFGVFLSGGPRALDMLGKLPVQGPVRDPLLGTKIITSAVVNALYRDPGIYTYYTLNGRSPLVVSPPLVAEPADV
jgi:putrescine aminotransferase